MAIYGGEKINPILEPCCAVFSAFLLWGRESWLLYLNCHLDVTLPWFDMQCVMVAFPSLTQCLPL